MKKWSIIILLQLSAIISSAVHIGAGNKEPSRNRSGKKVISACKLLDKKEYWEALYEMKKVSAEGCKLISDVNFRIGNCYDSLSLYSVAKKHYKAALIADTTSLNIKKCKYAIMDDDFRLEQFNEVCETYDTMYREVNDFDEAAFFTYVQSLMYLGKYSEALGKMSCVREKLNDQCRIKLLNGICYFRIGDSITGFEVLGKLERNCLEQNIEGAFLVGNFLQNKNDTNALKYYRMIMDSTPYTESALIGMCWTYMECITFEMIDSCSDTSLCCSPLNMIDSCINTLRKYPDSPLLPEILLLKGYSEMLKKQSRRASFSFDSCLILVNNRWPQDSAYWVNTVKRIKNNYIEVNDLVDKKIDSIFIKKIRYKITDFLPLHEKAMGLWCDYKKAITKANAYISFSERKNLVYSEVSEIPVFYTPVLTPDKINEKRRLMEEYKRMELEIEKSLDALKRELEKQESR